ncbi:MAG: SRPBCC family protein [Actinomycetota bacterium]
MAEFTRQPPEWTDRAPIKVRASREMLAEPAEVWAAICDHERWPEWFDALSGARGTGGEGLGSTRTVTVGNAEIDEEFIVWDEPRSWGFTVLRAGGPLGRVAESLNERIDIQVLSPDRVRVTYLMAFQPRRFAKPAFRVLSGGLKKNLRASLGNLERFIEAERTAPHA